MNRTRCISSSAVGICVAAFMLLYYDAYQSSNQEAVKYVPAVAPQPSVAVGPIKKKSLPTKLRRRQTTPSQPIIPSEPNVVFYNRVGKCGSRSLNRIVERLSKKNNFSFSYSEDYKNKSLNEEDLKREMKKISSLDGPAYYHRHIYFLDFEKYGYKKPVYINLIRDPIERFISLYNFVKYGGYLKIAEQIPEGFQTNITDCLSRKVGPCHRTALFKTGKYLCGQDKVCSQPSRESVALAKKRIDRDYLFIGLTEEFESSLRILEKVLPLYFSGAVKEWTENRKLKDATASYKHEDLTEELKEELRSGDMCHEYEVYKHVTRKFESMKRKYKVV